MRVNIAMPVFRRPKYAIQVMDSVHAYLPLDWDVFVSIDRANDRLVDQNMVNLFSDGRWSGRNIEVSIAPSPGGCNGNVFRALCLAWENKPDAVVCIEEDILISPDSGFYLTWALNTFQKDKNVRSITLWEPVVPMAGNAPDTGNTAGECLLQAGKFTCWSWATWEREWEGIQANWTTGGDHELTSWDVVLEQYWKDRYEVTPLISRATNIGEELGTHRGEAKPSALASWNDPHEYWINEALTIHQKKKVYVILGRFGDIYMVCKKIQNPSIVCCSKRFVEVMDLFPQHEVVTIDNDILDPVKAASFCTAKYPTHEIIVCQLDQQPSSLCKPFRNYQAYQEHHASL